MRTIGSGLLPIFTSFETFLCASFLLSLLNLMFTDAGAESAGLRTWGYGQVLLMLLITLALDKSPRPAYYDHGDPYIILFHLFRIISLSLMLFASVYYIRSWRISSRGGDPAAPNRSPGQEHTAVVIHRLPLLRIFRYYLVPERVGGFLDVGRPFL